MHLRWGIRTAQSAFWRVLTFKLYCTHSRWCNYAVITKSLLRLMITLAITKARWIRHGVPIFKLYWKVGQSHWRTCFWLFFFFKIFLVRATDFGWSIHSQSLTWSSSERHLQQLGLGLGVAYDYRRIFPLSPFSLFQPMCLNP